MRPVAVTGLGVLSGFGHGAAPFWAGLVGGESALRPLARLARDGAAPLAAEVPALEIRRVATTPLGRRIDRVSLFALAACRLALADAGVGSLVPDETGVALGSAFGNLGETTDFLDRLIDRGAGNPLVFPNMVMNASLSYVTIELGVTGPTAMFSELDLSGETAIGWGVDAVAYGEVECCLAGATDELAAALHQVLAETGAVGSGIARPLDPAAGGPAAGEGAAVLFLEPLAAAEARGARVYATIEAPPGFTLAASPHGWPRDAEALARALAPVLADADLVVAAARGTPALDRVEAEGLRRALGGRPAAVTAVRGAVGDFGAAGALGVAAAVLAVAEGVAPPATGAPSEPVAGLDVVVGAARRLPARVAVANGMARGGACRPIRLERTA
jgi:3-oxoacyl-(acyl-carrier-protein) synthase